MNHDPNNVYGLHFMDAQIDINNVVVADQVTILGVTHYNYEMPQDCINFQTNDKGIINFFAGTYFPGNSTFFSLHQVFRDGQEKITAIKEIAEVYKSDDGNILKPYIYKFTDNTYTNFDGTYTGATSLISGYSLILILLGLLILLVLFKMRFIILRFPVTKVNSLLVVSTKRWRLLVLS